MPRFAAIDVGTNSVLLIVAELGESGLETRLERAAVTRLGEGLSRDGRIGAAGAERTVAALARHAAEARALGVDAIAAVGTMGLRRAGNAGEFIDRVRAELGLSIRVISGEEEARLTWQGVVADLPVDAERLTVFDPGGGSTEFIWGSSQALQDRISLEMGVVTLTERFGLADAPDETTVRRARAWLNDTLKRPLADIPKTEALVAVGGTATTLAALRLGLAEYDPDRVHGAVFGRTELTADTRRLLAMTSAQRAALPGMEPRRADIIPAGCLILTEVLRALGHDALVISDRGLRHGVVAELAARHSS